MSQLRRTVWHVLMGSTVGLLAISSFAAGDRPVQEAKWENLEELGQGQEIKVVMNDAKAYRGLLQSVSNDGISVALATGKATFARQDILRVSIKTGSHRLRNAGIGAAIGGGSLAAVAAAAGSEAFGHGGAAILGLISGSAIGAVVGAVLPSEAWRDVYRAR